MPINVVRLRKIFHKVGGHKKSERKNSQARRFGYYPMCYTIIIFLFKVVAQLKGGYRFLQYCLSCYYWTVSIIRCISVVWHTITLLSIWNESYNFPSLELATGLNIWTMIKEQTMEFPEQLYNDDAVEKI